MDLLSQKVLFTLITVLANIQCYHTGHLHHYFYIKPALTIAGFRSHLSERLSIAFRGQGT